MKWQDHLDKINAKYPSQKDLEKEAFESWKEQFLSFFDDDERPQKEKEVQWGVPSARDIVYQFLWCSEVHILSW